MIDWLAKFFGGPGAARQAAATAAGRGAVRAGKRQADKVRADGAAAEMPAQRPLQRRQGAFPTANPTAAPAARQSQASPQLVSSGFGEDEDEVQPLTGPNFRRALPAAVTGSRALNASAGVSTREPTPAELEAVLAFDGKVLTADGGAIQINTRQRTFIAAMENGVLLVSKSHVAESGVLSARTILQKASYRLREVLLVDLETIRKVYDNHGGRSGTGTAHLDTAQMQRRVTDLIGKAARLRCSDIHITVRRYEALIRLRSDGVIMRLGDLDTPTAQDLCQAAFNMADSSDSTYKPFDYQSARISSIKSALPEGVQAVRLQFNPLPDNGRYMVMRLLYTQKVEDANGVVKDVDSLGYASRHIRQIKRMRDRPVGMVIISGPTGSGKSTTLQVCLDATLRQKNHRINVITVEDPPEYEIAGAAQLPVLNAKTEEDRRESFRMAITASLRSDPDTVMIGEIRDAPSASLAFQAAMTGHQVWASLHANNAISILDRLRDQGVETWKLADPSLITGLIGQRLVRRTCSHCSLTYRAGRDEGLISDELDQLLVSGIGPGRLDGIRVAKPGGCDAPGCRDGYSGRTVVAETILPDMNFMEKIAAGDKHGAYLYWLKELGGITMLEHVVMKVAQGEVDPNEIMSVGLLDEAEPDRLNLLFDEALPALTAA